MQPQINDMVIFLACDVEKKMPKKFEIEYYKKMSYSGENIIIGLEQDLLRRTISIEIAFIHLALLIFTKISKCEDENYHTLLKKIDVYNLFSWYKFEFNFLEKNIGKLNIEEYGDIYSLINSHDKLIHKNVKKKLGQFYTPIGIVQKMIMEVRDNIKGLTMKDRIADPACGTGVFLVEALKLLGSSFSIDELIQYSDKNIYAFDVNPFAIVATKINLLYALFIQSKSKSEKVLNYILETDYIFQNIQWKNTITEEDQNQYTIILGNPPYFKLNNKQINNISGYTEILFGQPNIYSFFMFWGIQHLDKNGAMCFIVPQSIRSGLYFKNLRSKICNLRIRSMIHIDSRQNIFDRAEQAVLIICLENKSVANTKTKIQFYNGDGSINTGFKIARSKLMMNESVNNIFVINRKKEMYDILDKIYANSSPLNDKNRNLKFSNGLFVWNQHKKDIVDYEESAIPIIYGGNVQPICFNFNQCSSNNERKQFAKVSDKTKLFVLTGKRLLVQRTTNFEKDIRLKACIIADNFLEIYETYFLENHVNFLCHSEGKDKLLQQEILYYYLGMLNSKLINYIFTSKSGNTQVSANELNSLPFPLDNIDTIVQFVRVHMENLKQHQTELDILVCDSYGLTEIETDFIINS